MFISAVPDSNAQQMSNIQIGGRLYNIIIADDNKQALDNARIEGDVVNIVCSFCHKVIDWLGNQIEISKATSYY